MVGTFGMLTALFLSEMIEKYESISWNDKVEDGWFFYRQDDVKKDCGISFDDQTNFAKILVKKGLLEQKKMGLPCKNYWRINYLAIQEILMKSSARDTSENEKRFYRTTDSSVFPAQNKQQTIEQQYNDTVTFKLRLKDNSIEAALPDDQISPPACSLGDTSSDQSKPLPRRKFNRPTAPTPQPSTPKPSSESIRSKITNRTIYQQ